MTFQGRELAGAFLDGILETEAMEQALLGLGAYVGASSAQLLCTDPELGFERPILVGEHDPDTAALEPEYWDDNPRIAAIPRLAVGQVVRDVDVIDRDQIARNRAYQELLIPAGLEHFAGIVMAADRDRLVALAGFRGGARDPFTDDEAARLRNAAEVIQPVVELARRIDVRENRLLVGAANQNEVLAVVDTAGRLKEAGDGFEELIAEGLLGQSIGGGLWFRDGRGRSAELRDVMQVGTGHRFVVTGSEQQPILWGQLSDVPNSGLNMWGTRYLLVLRPVRCEVQIDTRLLTAVFGLSAAECAVTAGLAQGLTVQQISRKRGTQISTTRTLLKSIFAKTGCRRQLEVVALILRLHR